MNPRSLFSRFYHWLYYKLYVESDDPNAPAEYRTEKHRKLLHNAVLMQVWAACSIIIGLPVAALSVVYLIRVPYFVLGYLVWAAVTSIVWVSGWARVKQLNEQDYCKTAKSSADLNATSY